jgi:hypothetical protein
LFSFCSLKIFFVLLGFFPRHRDEGVLQFIKKKKTENKKKERDRFANHEGLGFYYPCILYLAITRTFTLIYTLALLTMLTRIQLNLLGRRSYVASVLALASYSQEQQSSSPPTPSLISLEDCDDAGDFSPDTAYGGDFEVNRRYLTFSWWLLHRGWRLLMQRVEAAVRDVFGPVDPRESVSLERLAALTLDVRKRVEGSTKAERRCVFPFFFFFSYFFVLFIC